MKIRDKYLIRVRTHKCLRVILDEHLHWQHHISYIVFKTQNGCNIIRCLCRTWWAAHPSCLLLMYKALIMSNIEYGTTFMLIFNKALADLLQRQHLQALRMVIGAMKSTPISNILSECAEMNTKYRLTTVALKQIGKLNSFNHNRSKILFYNFINYLIMLTIGENERKTNRL